MKKIIKIFICTIISFCILQQGAEALTCNYVGENSSVKLEITDRANKTPSCTAWITSFDGKSMNNKEDCQEWKGEVSNTYILNGECPTYVRASYKAFSPGSAKVYVSYNQKKLESLNITIPNHLLTLDGYVDPSENYKENCSDYVTKDQCYYGVQDKNGTTCQWNIYTKICEEKRPCSDYLTAETCPEESGYGKCKWDSSTSQCRKYDKFTCSDYVTQNQCPDKDEEGNSCVWNIHKGCTIDKGSSGSNGGSSSEYETPDYKVDDSATLENTCSSPSFRKPMKFLGVILNFVKIIVPILIIGFGVLDLYKAVSARKDDGIKKAMYSIGVRLLAGVFIFLLPGIVQFILNMVNEWSGYQNAWCCCTDCLLNSDCDVNSCSSNSCHIEGTNK